MPIEDSGGNSGDRVREAFASPAPLSAIDPVASDCPLTFIGHSRSTYFFLTAGGFFCARPFRDLSEAGIADLCFGDMAWARKHFPKINGRGHVVGWQVGDVRDYLMSQCSEAGEVSPEKIVRRPGAWMDPTYGLILHCGDAVLVGSSWREAGFRLGGYVYPAGHPQDRPADEALSARDGEALLDFLGSWMWERPIHAPRLILGWAAAASVCGALDWRPHVAVSGEPGSGKSSLERLLSSLLGSFVERLSAPTGASVRNVLDGAAKPMFVDESEPENPRRQRELLEMARLASTGNQGETARATGDGRVFRWHMRASFYFTGVVFQRFSHQDLTRVCRLELGSLPSGETDDGRLAHHRHRSLMPNFETKGAAFRRRVIDCMKDGRARRNILAFEEAIAGAGGAARLSDQMGTLLGLAQCVLSDVPIDDAVDAVTGKSAAELVSDFILPDFVGHDDERGPNECLNHLLTSTVMADVQRLSGNEVRDGHRSVTVGELVAITIDEKKWANQELKRQGLAIKLYSGDPSQPVSQYLVVANNHRQLDRIFEGTQWARGGWSQLLRLPGAIKVDRSVYFAGATQRGIWIPVDCLPRPE